MTELEFSKNSDSTQNEKMLKVSAGLDDNPIRPFRNKESVFMFAVFFFWGSSCLLPWNNLLNVLPVLLEILYPTLGSFTDTMTATYFTVECVVSIVLSFYPVTNTLVSKAVLLGLLFLSLIFPFICIFAAQGSVSLFFHLYAVASGFCASVLLNAAYATAATLSRSFMATVSTGMGFSGLFSAAVWFVFSNFLFKKTVPDTRISISILMGTALVMNGISLVLLILFTNSCWIADIFRDNDKKRNTFSVLKDRDFKLIQHTGFDQGRNSFHALGYLGVFKKTYKSLLVRFFIFFQTLMVVPTIGPLAWRANVTNKELLTIMFQVGDFGGRYLTYILPVVNMRESYLLISLFIRTVLVVTFVLSMTLYTNAFFGNLAFLYIQIIIFAITDGWFSTTASVHLPKNVDGARAKSIAGAFGLSTAFLGVSTGQWISKAIKSSLYTP